MSLSVLFKLGPCAAINERTIWGDFSVQEKERNEESNRSRRNKSNDKLKVLWNKSPGVHITSAATQKALLHMCTWSWNLLSLVISFPIFYLVLLHLPLNQTALSHCEVGRATFGGHDSLGLAQKSKSCLSVKLEGKQSNLLYTWVKNFPPRIAKHLRWFFCESLVNSKIQQQPETCHSSGLLFSCCWCFFFVFFLQYA